MSRENEGYGKLVNHGEPAEAPSQSQVDKRASEIAKIEGREQPNKEDRARALEEIQGIGSRNREGIDAAEGEIARDPSEPQENRNGRRPRINEDDENQAAETAALEGVEEAEHEQMLQARRQRQNES